MQVSQRGISTGSNEAWVKSVNILHLAVLQGDSKAVKSIIDQAKNRVGKGIIEHKGPLESGLLNELLYSFASVSASQAKQQRPRWMNGLHIAAKNGDIGC